MFISIRTKLFALLILANALMVVLLLGFNAFTFNRSFSSYIEQREARRMSVLIENLADVYEDRGSWHWLRNDPATVASIVRESLNNFDFRGQDKSNSKGVRITYFEQLRISDPDGQIVFGRALNERKITWLSINNDDGKLIGKLGVELNNRLDAQVDELFISRLKLQLYLVGVAAFIIAGALAIPFSGWLVKPIQRITQAMRKMSEGDFSVSVDDDRKDELGRLAADFNHMATVLQKAQNDRQQWVSDIAHELRTPVAVLQGDIEAAQDGIRTVDDRWLANMFAHSERLNRLVSDLHQLSQSDAGTLSYRFEELDVNNLASEVVAQFRTSLAQRHIEVTFKPDEEPMLVDGDAERLAQLLTNLAQNTLRYTDGSAAQPGKLQVEISRTAETIQLIWEDSSPGVAAEHIPRLFDRLYRVDESRNRETGGSGLGLAIAKNIVEAHQGHISAALSNLGGLRICVQLPPKKES
ncbi:ATP-binding protein [Reinekea marinisedimentorum]|uniref:histidine kinase n=1 Tax=Reinekea marinisedimentorum TaxID=230495 RepID=A0A4R3I1D7_9GAMM|nr:ATP-binding protein [Reinekea marinisedimentorum]TCS37669.1 two-component system sensor histidine kinase BaeS [Reinekea marinisedimentorum]